MAGLDWHAAESDFAGLAVVDCSPVTDSIDLKAVRAYRQQRVRDEMAARGVGAVILSDPVNIRYATGARNMQVFSMRNAPARYLLLTADRCILFEFAGCHHLARGLETIDEVRSARTASFVAAGPRIAEREVQWAGEMADLIAGLLGPGATVGLERLNAGAALALAAHGFHIVDAQEAVERARAIKSAEEIKCVKASLRATEIAVGKLRDAIRPGITENALWSVLHQSVIEQNGDYCETRLMSTGSRTNPWFQESSPKVIGEDELIALDTDVVGVHGYYTDFSRTFHAGPNAPSAEQRLLYRLALEQIEHNVALLRPGIGFRDLSSGAWPIPDRYVPHRYYLMAHGCGMTGEWPYIPHSIDWDAGGYDGEIEPGMTLCVESFIGAEDGGEGVKLEEQILITETGIERLSRFPFEAALEAA